MKEYSACAKTKIIKAVKASAHKAAWVSLLSLVSFWARADEMAQEAGMADISATDPMASIGKVVFVLAAMIALILVLAYWAKRLQGLNANGMNGFSSQGKMIKTLATVSLGLKEKISLIQVGEQQILVGITPQSIQTLLVLETPIEQEDVEQQTPVFQTILKKALNKS